MEPITKLSEILKTASFGDITHNSKTVKVSTYYNKNTKRIQLYFYKVDSDVAVQPSKVTTSEKVAIKAINNFLFT